MTSEIFCWGQAFLAQGTDNFFNKMLSIRKVRLLITSRYIAMQSYECVIISKMFLIYFISYGCNGGALVFLRGAEASASPSFALPMFITIKKIIILHLFLGVPAATVGGTGTPWHTRGYAPGLSMKCLDRLILLDSHCGILVNYLTRQSFGSSESICGLPIPIFQTAIFFNCATKLN